ncbi:MAG: hypothetical protein K6E40_06295 [Desulfovibrio sp.]|nr:hypothetical protein [Desulfovibrio sp.]
MLFFGGIPILRDGDEVYGEIISSGGSQIISSGGSASSGMLVSGGVQRVYGLASATLASS